MTPQPGEPFILKCRFRGREEYLPATVEEARHGRVISARLPGPMLYRLRPGDEAIRFQSHRLRDTVLRLIDRFHPDDVWQSRDAALMALIEENAMTEYTREATQ